MLAERSKPGVRARPLPLEDPEITRLRLGLWRARGRNSRLAGVVLLTWGALFLALAFFTKYIVFEVLSVASLLLAAVFIFTDLEPHIKAYAANRAILSLLNPLMALMNEMKASGKASFVPSADGVRAWIPRAGAPIPDWSEPLHGDSIIRPEGLLLTSPGRGLFEMHDEELGGIRRKGLEHLTEWLPRAMSEGLRLSSRTAMMVRGDRVQTLITRPIVSDLCLRRDVNESICCTVGCPLVASLAEALAESTGRVVLHEGCVYDPIRREATATHRLGKDIDADFEGIK